MILWFERPIIYDVRARPHLVESTSGSHDLQLVIVFYSLFCPSHLKMLKKKKEIDPCRFLMILFYLY